MIFIGYMDGSERKGAEKGKYEHGSFSNRRKHVKLNEFKGKALWTMDSTSSTHSFNLRRISEKWHTLNMKELTINWEKTPLRNESLKNPNRCCKTSDLSLAKIWKICTMCAKVSQESNL